jgi:hypothetical protein
MNRPAHPDPAVDLAAAIRPIVFWGPKNSGKTTYLGQMLRRPDDLDEAADWSVTPADERSADYAANVLDMLRLEGAVRPTLFTEKPFWFKLQERRRFRPAAEWDLLVLDPKGEMFMRNRLRESDDRTVLDLVARSRGLLLLVDPTGPDAANSYWEMFADNIHTFVQAMRSSADADRRLDGHNRIRVATAVCLTKMDCYPDGDEPMTFLRTRLGAAHDLIQRSFTNYRVFASSALGGGGPGAAGKSSSSGNGSGSGRPWGLIPPLRWLTRQQRTRLLFP